MASPDYSKLMNWSPSLPGYAVLSGGINAWGLGGMGALRRGGFGSGGSSGNNRPIRADSTIRTADTTALTADYSR